MNKWLCGSLLFSVSLASQAHVMFCGSDAFNDAKHMSGVIDAYYSPERRISNQDLQNISDRLKHITVLSYGFGHIDSGKITLSKIDKYNIKLLNKWRYDHSSDGNSPEFAMVLAVGGWGDREKFTPFLTDKTKLDQFVDSANDIVANYPFEGIDVDWENVLLASKQEQDGVTQLLQQLKAELPDGACVSNAVPATPFYWQSYPNAKNWHESVDWSVVMGYDLYGTFGPFAEVASNLKVIDENKVPTKDYHYNYPESVSVAKAMRHYQQQGLAPTKEIMGVPFYCHSYYVSSAQGFGYRQPVFDPNISAQVPIKTALNIRQQGRIKTFRDGSSISLTQVANHSQQNRYQFLSCETPQSLGNKARYVKRHKMAGMSMWELSQDLSYCKNSLLRSMTLALGISDDKECDLDGSLDN